VFNLTDFPTYAYQYRVYFLVHVNCDAPDLDAQLCVHRNVWSVKSCHARLQRLLMVASTLWMIHDASQAT